MEHFLIVMMRVQYKGLYSSQSCYLEGTHLIFYALKYTYHLMALKQTNKTNLAQNGHKLEKLYLNRTKFERNAIYIERKFEQMGPKKCQMNHDNSFDKNIPDANSEKIIQSKRFCLLLQWQKRTVANILLSWSSLNKNLNRWDLKNVKWIMIIHLTKTFQMLIARKLYNQKDFACCFSDRKGPWPTFSCLGHHWTKIWTDRT